MEDVNARRVAVSSTDWLDGLCAMIKTVPKCSDADSKSQEQHENTAPAAIAFETRKIAHDTGKQHSASPQTVSKLSCPAAEQGPDPDEIHRDPNKYRERARRSVLRDSRNGNTEKRRYHLTRSGPNYSVIKDGIIR